MKRLEASLVTPVFLKTEPGEVWPDEKVFYLLTGDGLFLCRNHEFFQSCVPAPRWPSELEMQDSFLSIDYPRVPRQRIEQLVGFFDLAWRSYGGEAAAFLAWNRKAGAAEVIVPKQLATVGRNFRGDPYPVGVRYRIPEGLPEHVTIFCDIHSHCDMSAYASGIDTADETYRAGLHAVVGKLHEEPPQFHVEAVVDGTRFRVDAETLFGGYRRRSGQFPRSWLKNVRIKEYGVTRTMRRASGTGRSRKR